MIALRNLGSAALSPSRVSQLDPTRFIPYIRIEAERIYICREYFGSKPQTVVLILCHIQEEEAVSFLCRVQVSVIHTYTVFGV